MRNRMWVMAGWILGGLLAWIVFWVTALFVHHAALTLFLKNNPIVVRVFIFD